MKYQKDRVWLEIDFDIMERCYREVMAQIGENCKIMAVIKANAYGLGAISCGKFLEHIGCPYLAVASIEEALELREAGIKTPVLTLGPIFPHSVQDAVLNDIQVAVVSLDQAKALSNQAKALKNPLKIHIKADSGLSRFGLQLSDMDLAISQATQIASLDSLELVGVFTHYTAGATEKTAEFDMAQISLFDFFTDSLKKNGLSFVKHSASSAFTSQYPQCRNDYVRIAALLMGINEPPDWGFQTPQSTSLKTRIMQIKSVKMGTSISYGPTYYTTRDTTLAIVPIGYADGLRRSLSGKAGFLIHGKIAPIVGKITMDYTILDITDIPQAVEYDVVTVFGEDCGQAQYAYELSGLFPGTIGELASSLNPRIPRFYKYKGREGMSFDEIREATQEEFAR